MTGWRTTTLGDVCDSIDYGVTASASGGTGNQKLLRITDIVPPRLDWEAVPYCEVPLDKAKKFELHHGDIVVARTGATVGYAKYLKNPPRHSVFASYLVRFRVREGVDPQFVGHVVQSDAYKKFIATHAGGAAQPNANAKVLASFPLVLPNLPTQRRTASLLSACDELIEINERRIELLEDFARSLYREWFVHFRFPGHGTSRFVDSELGQIPDGWTPTAASRIFDLNPRVGGRAGSYPKVTMGDVSTRFSHVLPSARASRPSGVKFEHGDVLMARITPSLENGKTALVLFLEPKQVGIGSTELTVLRGSDVGPAFTYCAARSQRFRDHAIKSMSGASGRQRVASDCFDSLPVVRPAEEVAASFESVVMPMLEEVFQLRLQSDQLAATRDLLLPRLVTGQLDISDVDLGALTPPDPE